MNYTDVASKIYLFEYLFVAVFIDLKLELLMLFP